jgi:hypothetical protein
MNASAMALASARNQSFPFEILVDLDSFLFSHDPPEIVGRFLKSFSHILGRNISENDFMRS